MKNAPGFVLVILPTVVKIIIKIARVESWQTTLCRFYTSVKYRHLYKNGFVLASLAAIICKAIDRQLGGPLELLHVARFLVPLGQHCATSVSYYSCTNTAELHYE